MKTLTIAIIFILISTPLFAAEYVNGYLRSDGTYVQGHYRSSADNSYNNNYSTRGNSNPYTGQSGSNSPTWNDKTPQSNLNTWGDSGQIDSGRSSNPYFYNSN